jgi:hypothetical protein
MGSAAIPSQPVLITTSRQSPTTFSGDRTRRKNAQEEVSLPIRFGPKHPTNEAWAEKNREKMSKIRRNTYVCTYFYVFSAWDLRSSIFNGEVKGFKVLEKLLPEVA